MSGGRTAALRALKTVAVWGDRVRAPGRGAVVLIYHRVGGGSGTEIDLDPGLFDEQMAWLAASGRAASLDDALDAVSAPEPPAGGPGDPVVVTFDDGTADLAEVALPVLARHGVPATVYVATDFVDAGRSFPDDGTPLSWAGVREMVASGLVRIGSHTHTHALLDRLAPAAAAAELDRSIELIGEHAGVAADHFAYPKAVAAPASVEAEVRARFRSAAVGGNRPNPYGRTDPHRLARSAIQVSDGMDWFVRKAEGGMALEDTFRRTLNRVRYVGAGT
ncbi:MAG TPA: polysaccharide deacetylase family protein [Acidimicrobiales bacterium]